MTSLWELITEVTDHTGELVNLVILGVSITIATYIGFVVTGIIGGGNKPEFKVAARAPWDKK